MPESPYERRQREAVERALRAAMPDIQRLMRDVLSIRSDSLKILGEQYSRPMADMIKTLARDMPKFTVPALTIDYKTLFPDLSRLRRTIVEQWRPAIEAIQITQREQFAGLLSQVRATIQAALPPNWRGEDVVSPDNFEVLLLDEGLQLAWLPPKKILIRIFAAETAAERRTILGRNWRQITQAAIEELDDIDDDEFRHFTSSAKEAADSLLEGYTRASQALSANLLDSILRTELDESSRQRATGQKMRFSLDEYPIRVAIVLGGIWGAHGEYWPNNGDPIPRNFSRHASAHAVSKRQYSRINALLALMHVVALLKVLDTDLRVAAT